MDLSTLTRADLNKLGKLLAQKEKLQAQIDAIDRKLQGYGGGAASIGRRGPKRVVSSKKPAQSAAKPAGSTGRKGALKGKVINALKKAPATGIHISDLASKLKVKERNLRVWFYTTGKKVKGVQQVKPATFRWSA